VIDLVLAPESLDDRIDHGGARADRARLAGALDAHRIGLAGHVVGLEGKGRCIGGTRKCVVHIAAGHQLGIGMAVDHLLHQRLADALHRAAVDLASQQQRIERHPEIIDDHIVHDPDDPGGGVDPKKLNASATFASADGTYPNGTHIAEVEIDPATGIIKIVGYVIVDDFGVTLNPLLLAGQVHGGVMQGIGQALMEQVVYSPNDAQLVTGTYMDYALPRAADGPSFHFETHNVPCKTNPMGVKGAGEAGAIGSCPAVVNAIVEGLWREYKIDHIDMPATPERVWIAIREQHRRHSL